jgi:hypothetical protein
MRLLPGLRIAAVALVALFAATLASPSQAATGTVELSVVKGGWFVGGQAGGGTLHFHGRSYKLAVGGVSVGLTFGGSVTRLAGTARNIHRPSDVAGVYTAVQAGGAIGAGARVITLRNANGAVLQLHGVSAGLALDLDLSGMTIALQQ